MLSPGIATTGWDCDAWSSWWIAGVGLGETAKAPAGVVAPTSAIARETARRFRVLLIIEYIASKCLQTRLGCKAKVALAVESWRSLCHREEIFE